MVCSESISEPKRKHSSAALRHPARKPSLPTTALTDLDQNSKALPTLLCPGRGGPLEHRRTVHQVDQSLGPRAFFLALAVCGHRGRLIHAARGFRYKSDRRAWLATLRNSAGLVCPRYEANNRRQRHLSAIHGPGLFAHFRATSLQREVSVARFDHRCCLPRGDGALLRWQTPPSGCNGKPAGLGLRIYLCHVLSAASSPQGTGSQSGVLSDLWKRVGGFVHRTIRLSGARAHEQV